MRALLICRARDYEKTISNQRPPKKFPAGKAFLLFAVFLVVIGVLYRLNSAQKPASQGIPSEVTNAVSQAQPNAVTSPQANALAPTDRSSEGVSGARTPGGPPARKDGLGDDYTKKTATELAPDAETLREEVQKDPELVPRSTLFFAARLGKKMEVALRSEDGAASLFQELQDCVTSQRLEGSVTSRTLCLQDAQELAHAYPGRLKEQYSALYDRAEPRVRDLLIPTNH